MEEKKPKIMEWYGIVDAYTPPNHDARRSALAEEGVAKATENAYNGNKDRRVARDGEVMDDECDDKVSDTNHDLLCSPTATTAPPRPFLLPQDSGEPVELPSPPAKSPTSAPPSSNRRFP
jgi:hypothetical protein